MSIEQRLAAVEKALADLTMQHKTTEELARLMRETAIEAIKREQRPGGCLYKLADGKAAQNQVARENSVTFRTAEFIVCSAKS